MSMKFPEMANSGKASVKGDEITFTYLNSYIKPITETKSLLDADGIIKLVQKRMKTFYEAPAGARESDELRTDRKYVAAHPLSILRRAFNEMNEEEKMEFDMMLSHSSHHGISDLKEVEEYADPQEEIPFAGEESHEMKSDNSSPLKEMSRSYLLDEDE